MDRKLTDDLEEELCAVAIGNKRISSNKTAVKASQTTPVTFNQLIKRIKDLEAFEEEDSSDNTESEDDSSESESSKDETPRRRNKKVRRSSRTKE